MKKFILIIILFFSIRVSSQVCSFYINEHISIEIDESLTSILDNYIEKCNYYEIDLNNFSLINGIYIKAIYPNFGITFLKTNIIFIDFDIPNYLPTLKKAVIYHEIAHTLKLNNHDYYGPYLLRSGQDINIEELIKNWNFYEYEYFKYLKNNL